MIINSVSNTYPTPRALSTGSANQANASNNVSPSSSSVSNDNKTGTMDFTNMTPYEYANITKTGQLGDLSPRHFFIVLPDKAHSGASPDQIAAQQSATNNTTRFNYIGNLESLIASNQRAGFDTTEMKNLLSRIEELQGRSFPATTIDTHA